MVGAGVRLPGWRAIETPALRELPISPVFAADDPESFVAFLRSPEGVRVEVTSTRIRAPKIAM